MKVFDWMKECHHWQHLLGGLFVGILADAVYCAALAGIGIAGALEFKDWQWGGKPDIADFLLTVGGTAIGYAIRLFAIQAFII